VCNAVQFGTYLLWLERRLLSSLHCGFVTQSNLKKEAGSFSKFCQLPTALSRMALQTAAPPAVVSWTNKSLENIRMHGATVEKMTVAPSACFVRRL
jgi:hypothetical protein